MFICVNANWLCSAHMQTKVMIKIWIAPPQKLIVHRMLIDYITQTFMNTKITFGNIKQSKK